MIPESALCTMSPSPPYIFEVSSLLFFFIPMTIMVFLYVSMGLRIRKPPDIHAHHHSLDRGRQQQSKKAILKMLGE